MALRPDTKKILFEALEELLETRSIENITVQQIIDHCGASRSTFYRHFKDKYDLMTWVYSKELEQIISKFLYSSYQDVTYELMNFLQSKKSYFSNIAQAEVQNSFPEAMYPGIRMSNKYIFEFPIKYKKDLEKLRGILLV